MNLAKIAKYFIKNGHTLSGKICFINKRIESLSKIEKMGFIEFAENSYKSLPNKLYKYFPNAWTDNKDEAGNILSSINYSLQALITNKVFLQNPINFDDIYDSEIALDYEEYEKYRLGDLCFRSGRKNIENFSKDDLKRELINVVDVYIISIEKGMTISSLFANKENSEKQDLSDRLFVAELIKNKLETGNYYQALDIVLRAEFDKIKSKTKERFRVSCFTTEPFSQLMWGGSYANYNRGFCIEYTTNKIDEKYRKCCRSLFPVIYSKTRDSKNRDLAYKQDKFMTNKEQWSEYFNGVLRKSADWTYQNEWRLVVPSTKELELCKYCLPFFEITKVFVGCRISKEDLNIIDSICKNKRIPLKTVERSKKYFEFQEADIY